MRVNDTARLLLCHKRKSVGMEISCAICRSTYLIDIFDVKEMPLHRAQYPVNIYTSHLSYPRTLRSSD